MKRKHISIVGVYGQGENFTTGQAVKCFEVINWFKEKYGDEQIGIVNTYAWKKNPVKLFVSMIKAFRVSDNIILMPAQHGLKIFAPMAAILKKIFGKQVHYVVIGGWLANMLDQHKILRKCVLTFDGVYVETEKMVHDLRKLGVDKVLYMPNCRKYVDKQHTVANKSKLIRVCTYSRVVKEKGIIDAIKIVQKANEFLGEKKFILDIYGKIALEFKNEFELIIAENENDVKYCGVKNSDQGAETLEQYFCLLFPTYYIGEGFAGTILDAFVARTPVIANDWKYNKDIIKNRENGFIYPFRNIEQAARDLCELYENENLYKYLQNGCYISALMYSTDAILGELDKKMK